MKKEILITCLSIILIASFFVTSIEAVAQLPIDKEIELTKQVVQAQRQLIIGNVMELTSDEAAGFWPIYIEYRAALAPIVDRRIAQVQMFAENYTSLTDEVSLEIMDEYLSIRQAKIDLMKEYMAKINEVLPDSKTLRYFQTESKLDAFIEFDLAAQIPLAGDWAEGIEE